MQRDSFWALRLQEAGNSVHNNKARDVYGPPKNLGKQLISADLPIDVTENRAANPLNRGFVPRINSG
jgi:hypothetical protein